MTIDKQLYILQELELALERLQLAKAEADEELSLGLSIDRVETSLQEEDERLLQVQSQHRLQQSEVETLRERSARLEAQLYSGEITNPRDLESLGQEVTHARELLEQQDAELLQLSVQAEESQNKRDSLERELSESRTTWAVRQAELQSQVEGWTSEVDSLLIQRKDLVDTLDPSAVQRYESLRKTKGGVAVAKVERGLCQGCRMALPTQQQQRVRIGRQTVLCSSCGRILILS